MKQVAFQKKADGRCYTSAMFAGFRAGYKHEINMPEIRQYLLTLMARQNDPLLQARFGWWIGQLRVVYPNKETLRVVYNDMKNRFPPSEQSPLDSEKSNAQKARDRAQNIVMLGRRQFDIYEVMDWLEKMTMFARSGKPETLYPNEEL